MLEKNEMEKNENSGSCFRESIIQRERYLAMKALRIYKNTGCTFCW